MPDINLSIGHRISRLIDHPPGDEQRLSRRVGTDDAAAIVDARRLHAPERAEQVLRRLTLAVLAIVEQADESGDAQRAAHHHRLVVTVGGRLAHLVDQRGGGTKFRFGQAHIGDEAVQMFDE